MTPRKDASHLAGTWTTCVRQPPGPSAPVGTARSRSRSPARRTCCGTRRPATTRAVGSTPSSNLVLPSGRRFCDAANAITTAALEVEELDRLHPEGRRLTDGEALALPFGASAVAPETSQRLPPRRTLMFCRSSVMDGTTQTARRPDWHARLTTVRVGPDVRGSRPSSEPCRDRTVEHRRNWSLPPPCRQQAVRGAHPAQPSGRREWHQERRVDWQPTIAQLGESLAPLAA